MIILVFGCALLGGNYLRNIKHAEKNKSAERLRLYLQNPTYSYVREQAALSLARIPKDKQSITLLKSCLSNPKERDFVRAACAQPLGEWKIRSSDVDMIAALRQVDSESAYWIAYSLKKLQTPQGIAALTELKESSDFFISASAREWLGE